MRASILKKICVLGLVVVGMGLSGCCSNCKDQWAFYKPCDLIEGQAVQDCSPSCGPCS